LKVLLIDVNCKNSSTGKIVYDLYTDLKNSGHTAAICYGRGPIIEEPDIYKFSSDIEMYLHALLTRLTGLTGCFSPFATHNLIKFMKRYKPDAVHIHELHAYFVNLAPVINYLKCNNIKTVWTFHCEFMYTGKCGHAYDCEKWKTQCGHCPQVKEYPASWGLDFTRKMFKDKKALFAGFDNLTIVTPSQWLADRVKQSFLGDKTIQVVYNGIDTDNIFHPRKFDHLKEKYNITDEKIILSVAPGLMEPGKGGRYVIALAEKMHNEKVKFILIGVDDPSGKFADNVIILGRIKNQIELSEYYSMADITILVSMKETFSLICAESLACGTPIAGFDSGAPKEVAPEGYGSFVPYGEIDTLERTIRQALEHPEVYKSKDECVSFCQKHYAKQIMYSNYLKLYLK